MTAFNVENWWRPQVMWRNRSVPC